MEISELLDRAKARLRLTSDRQLAKAIGIDPASLTLYRREKNLPTDDRMMRLCLVSGTPVEHGLLLLNMWRSSGDTRTAYRRIFNIVMSEAQTTDNKKIQRTAGVQVKR